MPARKRPAFRPLSNSVVLLVRGLLGCLIALRATAALSSTYTVTNLNDSGPGSLRAAMTSAARDSAGKVEFSSGLIGTINLFTPLPTVSLPSGSLTITGPGAAHLTISGQNKTQILAIASGTVTISGLTLANGLVSSGTGYTVDPGWGGAIYLAKRATLNLSNDVFSGNVTTAGAGGGGAILTEGNLTITGTTFAGNASFSNDGGGAIFNIGTLKVSGSAFLSNTGYNEGSAIVNYGNGPIGVATIQDTTFANNVVPLPAGSRGAVYNESGATITITNSTFAGNMPSVGGSIANAGGMTLENNVFVEPDSNSRACTAYPAPAGQCPAVPSDPDANGNFDDLNANLKLLGLGFYGGPTQSLLPAPGSPLICHGLAAHFPAGVPTGTDQRGFPNENPTYTGYSASAPCVDSGAVQTNYTAVQFVGGPYVASANTPGERPPVIVAVTENGQNIGGVPVTLSFSGAGSASGLTASTIAGTGATFSSMVVTQPSAPTDSLSVAMTVVGNDILTAGPATLTVKPQGAATAITATNAAANTLSASVTLSAVVTSSGNPVTEGQVSFAVQGLSTESASVNLSGTATVSYPLPGHLAATTYPVTIRYTDLPAGPFAPSSTVGQLIVTTVTPTVSTRPTANTIDSGQTLASLSSAGGTASGSR